jgi:prophage maintenance system killer protein
MQEVARASIAEYVSDRPARLRSALERVRTHALVDGNKPVAWAATRVFLLAQRSRAEVQRR